MTKPISPAPSRKTAPRLPLRDQELASRLLYHRDASRPASTLAWAVAAGLAAMPLEPSGQPGILTLRMDLEVWLDALFNDWRLGLDPWDKQPREAALALMQLMISHSRAILPPLPAYPARPALTGAVLDRLWAHVDFAAWRMVRFLEEPELATQVDPAQAVMAKLQDSMDLLEQFGLMILKAYTDQGASAQDYTEELAALLLILHQALDAAASKAGRDPLGWTIPDYRRFAGTPISLPPGPRGPLLPEPLAADFRKALADRECARPLASLGLLFGCYGALKAALEPGWTWSPARDGRECAFIVFESSMLDLPPWTPTQARELSRLCTAAHAWFKDQPLPPLPTLELDPSDSDGTALWQHQDLLFLAGSTLGPRLGILPDFDDGTALKRSRRLREQWGDVQSLIWGTTFHWAAITPDNRKLLAASLPLALSAWYQAFRNEVAKVDRTFLRFVPKPPESLLPAAKKAMVRFGRVRKR